MKIESKISKLTRKNITRLAFCLFLSETSFKIFHFSFEENEKKNIELCNNLICMLSCLSINIAIITVIIQIFTSVFRLPPPLLKIFETIKAICVSLRHTRHNLRSQTQINSLSLFILVSH